LAWACAEKLVKDIGSYSLFATHYFELTQIPALHDKAVNVHFDAIEHGEKIVFMHQLKLGPANQSYGIQVAKLAGVPDDVIAWAKDKLAELEANRQQLSDSPQGKQNDLFTKVISPSKIEKQMMTIDPNDLTPKQALEVLYQLKKMSDEEG